jgi:hypothetical protein
MAIIKPNNNFPSNPKGVSYVDRTKINNDQKELKIEDDSGNAKQKKSNSESTPADLGIVVPNSDADALKNSQVQNYDENPLDEYLNNLEYLEYVEISLDTLNAAPINQPADVEKPNQKAVQEKALSVKSNTKERKSAGISSAPQIQPPLISVRGNAAGPLVEKQQVHGSANQISGNPADSNELLADLIGGICSRFAAKIANNDYLDNDLQEMNEAQQEWFDETAEKIHEKYFSIDNSISQNNKKINKIVSILHSYMGYIADNYDLAIHSGADGFRNLLEAAWTHAGQDANEQILMTAKSVVEEASPLPDVIAPLKQTVVSTAPKQEDAKAIPQQNNLRAAKSFKDSGVLAQQDNPPQLTVKSNILDPLKLDKLPDEKYAGPAAKFDNAASRKVVEQEFNKITEENGNIKEKSNDNISVKPTNKVKWQEIININIVKFKSKLNKWEIKINEIFIGTNDAKQKKIFETLQKDVLKYREDIDNYGKQKIENIEKFREERKKIKKDCKDMNNHFENIIKEYNSTKRVENNTQPVNNALIQAPAQTDAEDAVKALTARINTLDGRWDIGVLGGPVSIAPKDVKIDKTTLRIAKWQAIINKNIVSFKSKLDKWETKINKILKNIGTNDANQKEIFETLQNDVLNYRKDIDNYGKQKIENMEKFREENEKVISIFEDMNNHFKNPIKKYNSTKRAENNTQPVNNALIQAPVQADAQNIRDELEIQQELENQKVGTRNLLNNLKSNVDRIDKSHEKYAIYEIFAKLIPTLLDKIDEISVDNNLTDKKKIASIAKMEANALKQYRDIYNKQSPSEGNNLLTINENESNNIAYEEFIAKTYPNEFFQPVRKPGIFDRIRRFFGGAAANRNAPAPAVAINANLPTRLERVQAFFGRGWNWFGSLFGNKDRV